MVGSGQRLRASARARRVRTLRPGAAERSLRDRPGSFYNAFFSYCDELRQLGNKVIVCGDFNTAHTPLDLARAKENETTSGFMPIEREWISELVRRNYVDVFREKFPTLEKYSWWSYRSAARDKNIGWRIDYFMVDKPLIDQVSEAFILNDVMGSDHCPVGIVLTNA